MDTARDMCGGAAASHDFGQRAPDSGLRDWFDGDAEGAESHRATASNPDVLSAAPLAAEVSLVAPVNIMGSLACRTSGPGTSATH
jgi:hypothetical protein